MTSFSTRANATSQGAIIVERWSARKWIARIMISWGIVTILIGFVHTAVQFYVVRFFLGAAEAPVIN